MRIIDADALPRHGQRGGIVYWKDIEDAPIIEPSIPKGEWMLGNDGEYSCSNCKSEAPLDEWEYKYRDKIRANLTPYCPNCGADMR